MEPEFLGNAHFWVGCLSMAAGFIAFATRKGGQIHRKAGLVFVFTMTLLSLSGLWLSIARQILPTVFLSGVAFHLILTSWTSTLPKRSSFDFVTRFSGILSGLIVLGIAYCGVLALQAPDGQLIEIPAFAFFIVSGLVALIFISDVSFAKSENPSRKRRITRHLWRMGIAFFLSTGIFFGGNTHVLPEYLKHPVFLTTPVIAVLLWTLYYIVRVNFLDGRKPMESQQSV